MHKCEVLFIRFITEVVNTFLREVVPWSRLLEVYNVEHACFHEMINQVVLRKVEYSHGGERERGDGRDSKIMKQKT